MQIFTNPLSEAAAKMLANIVPRMSNLERLGLRAERSFVAYPYLVPAFAALQTVKVLIVFEAGSQTCEMIRTLQSELFIASILYDPADQFDPRMDGSRPARHPLQLLQRSASTLRELTCGFWCDVGTEPESLLIPPDTIYPEVRTLKLLNNAACSPIPYIYALPNLTHLSSESYLPVAWEYGQLDLSQSQRRVNMLLQRLSLPDDVEEPGPFVWKDIQSYTGPLSDLWALGTTFPIPRLTLTDAPGLRAPLALTEVLASARPTHLTIAFGDQPLSSVLQSDLLGALRSEGAAGLRTLELGADLMAGDVDRNVDVGQALASIEIVLLGLQLNNIMFILRDITPAEDAPNGEPRVPAHATTGPGHNHSTPSTSTGNTAQSASSLPATAAASAAPENLASLTLAERTLEEFDVQVFVRRLSESPSLPTLQNVMVTIGRPRRCGGRLRSACMGRKDDRAPPNVYTGGKVQYKELRADVERRRADRPLTCRDIPTPWPSLASLSRAQYENSTRRGGRGVVGLGLGAFPGVGAAGGM
ncbi:hypothetical protein GSI_07727 [Ganoderma sinense ZZ0214-1]|uniref:Uncharacterized protein n=1 Tax=Ganoderma sinense ZZ0214-1 TaxID=1077348 RepID=A0A2G8S8P5_9APHY|nr:hypothetical protein GSI_07727 [Ganoderma sinense ZZ0214-1]